MKHYLMTIKTFIVNMLMVGMMLALMMVLKLQEDKYKLELLKQKEEIYLCQDNMSSVWAEATAITDKYNKLKRSKR